MHAIKSLTCSIRANNSGEASKRADDLLASVGLEVLNFQPKQPSRRESKHDDLYSRSNHNRKNYTQIRNEILIRTV